VGKTTDLGSSQDVPFEELLAYDTDHFSGREKVFLKNDHQQTTALVKLDKMRKYPGTDDSKVFEGTKWPFPDTPDFANGYLKGTALFQEVIFFVTPVRLLRGPHGTGKIMVEYSGQRMYTKMAPALPSEIFGVTTFELG
jgi:hypothetical protein